MPTTDELVTMYRNGARISTIAHTYGIDYDALRSLIRTYEPPRRRVGIRTGRATQTSQSLDLRNIQSIGVEMEGGINVDDYERWLEYSHGKRGLHAEALKGDGSVQGIYKNMRGEINMWVKADDFGLLKTAIQYLYNDCRFATNRTCGLHVHLKFSNMEKAMAIFSYKAIHEKFYDKYKEKWRNSQKHMDRLTNTYCNARYELSNMISALCGSGNRYKGINLTSYFRHRTIEIRILPHASSFTEFKENIEWLLSTIESLMDAEFSEEINTVMSIPTFEDEVREVLEMRQATNNGGALTFLGVLDLGRNIGNIEIPSTNAEISAIERELHTGDNVFSTRLLHESLE